MLRIRRRKASPSPRAVAKGENAARTSAMCESAWGKLPSSCLLFGSYSSERRPTSLARDPLKECSCLFFGTILEHVHLDQPEAARQSGALPGPPGIRDIPDKEAIPHQLPLDRVYRAHDARIVRRQQTHDVEASTRSEPKCCTKLSDPCHLLNALRNRLRIDSALLARCGLDARTFRRTSVPGCPI